MMRFMRASEMTMPSTTGKAPPERPVPAPRATKGTASRAQTPTIAATSAVEPGRTTSSGVARQPVSPSQS